MKRTTNTFAAILILIAATVGGCELGDELNEFEPSDELLDAADEAFANAELPDAVIVGGQPNFTDHGSVGYMTSPTGYICSGQRIGKTLFLTAAHCVNEIRREKTPWSSIKVGFGQRSQDYHVKASSAWSNPRYNGKPGSPYDIGVVVMSRGLPNVPNASIGRISLNQSVSLMGYGAPTYERRTGLAYVSDRLSNGHFAVQGVGAGICGGDSGGGVMNPFKQNQVLGINAYGTGCGTNQKAGVMDPRRNGNLQPLQYFGAKFD